MKTYKCKVHGVIDEKDTYEGESGGRGHSDCWQSVEPFIDLPTVVELAKEKATFVKYHDGKLWYKVPYDWDVSYAGTYCRWFDFPIPVDDAGGGEFGPSEKGLTLMRWIRKHLEYLRSAGQ